MQQNEMFRDSTQQHKTRVLVVDDDRLVLATLAKGLRQWGYEVAEASSGETALKLALETSPDLVLLDVNMPRMSGLEVAKSLRAQTTDPIHLPDSLRRCRHCQTGHRTWCHGLPRQAGGHLADRSGNRGRTRPRQGIGSVA